MSVISVIVGVLWASLGLFACCYLAIKLTRQREPWMTVVLLTSLAGTVVGMRFLITGGFRYDLIIWLVAVAIFSLLRVTTFRRPIEAFAPAHMFAVGLCFCAVAFDMQMERRHRPPNTSLEPTTIAPLISTNK